VEKLIRGKYQVRGVACYCHCYCCTTHAGGMQGGSVQSAAAASLLCSSLPCPPPAL